MGIGGRAGETNIEGNDVSDEKPLNIYQRLNKVREAVSYVQKDKRVDGQNYLAVTHDAVTALVRPLLVAQGIVVVPTLFAAKMLETGTSTAKGVPFMRYEGTYDIAFVNVDSPDDRVTIRLESHAIDQGDKAPGKAISYAVKYAMLKLFSLETGEDEEGRQDAERKREATKPIKPTDGAMDGLDDVDKAKARNLASSIVDAWDSEDMPAAAEMWENCKDNDIKVAAWGELSGFSKRRNEFKKYLVARTAPKQ